MCEFAIPGAQNTTVLVVGATSRVGRIVVRKLMLMGYSVKLWSCRGSGDCVFFGCAIGLLLFLDSVDLTFRSSWYFFTKCMKFSGVRRVLAVLSIGVFSLADSSHSVAFFCPFGGIFLVAAEYWHSGRFYPLLFFWNLAFSGGLVADWFSDLMFLVDSGSVSVLLLLP
ncbi:hypothetical protein L1887_36393 [Cichorium endivia]|nr:hypothetical protein L1887_36393 [Cichorium endivia]